MIKKGERKKGSDWLMVQGIIENVKKVKKVRLKSKLRKSSLGVNLSDAAKARRRKKLRRKI